MDRLQQHDIAQEARSKDSLITSGNFTKKHTSESRSIVIENKDRSLLIDMSLSSPYKVMVGAGESVRVAVIRLKDWAGKNDLFDELGFYDRKSRGKLSKTFTLKYAEDKTVTITEPIPDGSGKEVSFDVVRPDWDNAVEFKSLNDLPHKDISVGIYTKTVLGEKVEWLPTIDGFDVIEWAAYDVTQIDSLEYDTTYGYYNSLVMIDATHFILAYAGTVGTDGFISTFSIDGSYDNITQIDSLEHDTVSCSFNSLVMIDATHFILAYTGTGDDGFIKTFSIDGSYNITQIDSLEHDIKDGIYNSLVMIDATHFILAYQGDGDYGFIKTFSIDGSYDNITQIDSLKHDINSGYGIYNSLVMIDATHFILAYAGIFSVFGYIKTFSIDGSYDNITQIDSLKHDTVSCSFNSLVMIDATHFILAYQGDGDDGFIKTFSIDGSYNITQIDSLEHDTEDGKHNSLVMIDATHFILAYQGDGDDGFIKTFSIDGSYDNITQISSLEHNTENYFNSLVMIDATHFILAYGGTGQDGYIKTFSMEAPVSAPTVTTQAATSVADTTATGNGNITDDGGATATRGMCWSLSTTPTTSDSHATNGTGEGAYTVAMTGLSSGRTYYIRAYATNSAGTSYGAQVQILTKPSAPTSVAASENDGEKVVVTWTKATGATGYQIYRGSTALGWLGDVATGNDTGGNAPIITPGAAVASDGTSTLHVALNLSGESIANGTTYAYKVRAKNATGESVDSSTDNGYRDAQTVTYQWQRSAGDSDASYSNIAGATTEAYNDTAAPENSDARYYKCIQNATGSVEATSSADRGYRKLSTSIKSINGVSYADIKTINGVAIADIKAFNGVSNVS